MGHGIRERAGRVVGVSLVLLLTGASLVLTTSVAPSSPAAAANVTVGPIQAQQANHRGTSGTSGNCILYSPKLPGQAASRFVSSTSNPNEARTAHGKNSNNCPGNLDIDEQSAIGFRPSAAVTVPDSTQFLIGRMIHYNNPVQTEDRYFTGDLNIRLDGIAGTPTLNYPWNLDETPNSGSGNCCNDLLAFLSQISPITFTQGGFTYRLVIFGFVPIDTSATCPATPSGPPVNEFSTVERATTHACLYASLQQDRSPLTVIKRVVGSPPAEKTFRFTSDSSLAGSAWEAGEFTLQAGEQESANLTSGETITVTEADPDDDRWALTTITCTQVGANGQPQPVPGMSVDLAARQVVLANIPAPPDPDQPGITCTFTNVYTPKATLTLAKEVASGDAEPGLWTLTATGPVEISGRAGSPEVTARRVRAGTYALTELGTGAAETGYVQQGNWVCHTVSGANVPVTPGGNVTLTDSAQSNSNAAVTCTVTNRQATGSLQINKVVADPLGGFTGGTDQDVCRQLRLRDWLPRPVQHADDGDTRRDLGHPGRSIVHGEREPAAGRAGQRFVRLGPGHVQHAAGDDRRRGHGGGDDHQPGDPALRNLRCHQGGVWDRAGSRAATTVCSRSSTSARSPAARRPAGRSTSPSAAQCRRPIPSRSVPCARSTRRWSPTTATSSTRVTPGPPPLSTRRR